MRSLFFLNRMFIAAASVLALVHCGPSETTEEESDTENAADAIHAGMTVPPEEAGIGYDGLAYMVTESKLCAERFADNLLLTKCDASNSRSRFAVYRFVDGVEFCTPGTLRRIGSDSPKSRSLELYVATCLDQAGSNGLRLVQNFPLSWRRAGAKGTFDGNRRGSFEYDRDGTSFEFITDRISKKKMSGKSKNFSGDVDCVSDDTDSGILDVDAGPLGDGAADVTTD